jgi:catechol 2,3-dioxygenase-like lactoylglutathione lyase family enzyme
MNTFHISLEVADVAKAVDSYRKILGIEPAKLHPEYAKFEIADPPVILSLIPGEAGRLSHLGIRYPSTGDVVSELVRVRNHAVDVLEQKDVTCCYATADKFWVRDADAVRWEMYAVKADAETFGTNVAVSAEIRDAAPATAPRSCTSAGS